MIGSFLPFEARDDAYTVIVYEHLESVNDAHGCIHCRIGGNLKTPPIKPTLTASGREKPELVTVMIVRLLPVPGPWVEEPWTPLIAAQAG